MTIEKHQKQDQYKTSKIKTIFHTIMLGIFLVFHQNTAQAQTNQKQATEKTTKTEITKEKLANIRNEHVYNSIKNYNGEKMPIHINYGENKEKIEKLCKVKNIEIPENISFDAKKQEVILGNIKMKIEMPKFIYSYSTFIGDIKIEISNFVFQNFRYDKNKDKFFFKAKFNYKCLNGNMIDGALKGLGLGKFLEKIPFKKKNMIRLVKLALENEIKTEEKNEKVLHTTYDMQDEDGTHITDINVTITY